MFLTVSLTGRMGVEPISPVKVCVIIDTMLNFEGDFYGRGNGVITCKQTIAWKITGELDTSKRTHCDIFICVQFKVLLVYE